MPVKKAVAKTGRKPLPPEMIYHTPPEKGETEDQKAARIAHNAKARSLRLVLIGTKRVNRAVKSIQLIGNLAAYKPKDEQVDKICQALAEACQLLEARLRGTIRKDVDFTL